MDRDRDRGILTPTDREFLLGESEIESKSQSERNARARIRKRLRNAVLDFPILLEHLEDRDLKQVFDPDVLWHEIDVAIPAGIGLLYLDDEEVFETRVLHGIKSAEIRKGYDADVTVDIEVDRELSIDRLAERVAEAGDETDVTVRQLNVLLEAGEIDPERYGRLVKKRLKEGTIKEGLAITDVPETDPDE